MHSFKQNALTGGWALRNENTRRDDLVVNKDGTYAFTMAPKPTFFDDFLGDVLADQWGSLEGADDSTSVVATISAAVNGVVRLVTGDSATTTMAGNGVQIHSQLNWKANSGNLIFECRLKLSAITNVAVFVGLTDQISALEIPIESAASSDTLTSNATDAVGFMFDTSQANDKWWLVGVKNGTAATAQNSAIAPVAATDNILRIEVDSSGNATFYIDGVKVGSQMSGAVTATVALTPVVAATSRSTASRNIDIDYILVQSDRA